MPDNNPFFPKLFSPGRIGEMELRNRIVMPPMGTGHGSTEGYVTEKLTDYYEARAKGGVGLVIIEVTCVDAATGMDMPGRLVVDDDKFVPGLSQLAEAIHRHGAKAALQLHHGGRVAKSALTGRQPVAPSAIPMPSSGWAWENPEIPRELTIAEIKQLVNKYAEAAQRARKAGFDAVDIHAQGLYLPAQFLSAASNKRQDEYGGELKNRARFLLEIIRAIRQSLGSKVPIGVRVNGDDFIGQGGWNLSELSRLAPILERETVDYVSISAGASTMGTLHYTVMPMYQEQGIFSHFSEEIKKHVSIPVSIVGRIKDPVMADRLIAEKKADLVVMARAQIADPEMVEKARNGDMADIRWCLGDCLGCIEGILRHGEATCTVNPRLGREYLIREVEGEKKAAARRVLVAGAGPAGLEAARRAAFAGHKVTLCESRGWIGGQMRLAAMMPKRSEIGDIISWYERQLNKLGVEIRLNVTVDAELLGHIRPDVLVIATGSLPEVPLGFVDGLSHIRDIEVLMVDELVEDTRLTGDAVLVVGGDQIGLQVADYLAERG